MYRTLSTTLLLLALSLLTGCMNLLQNHLGPYHAYGTKCYVHKPGVINYLMADPPSRLEDFVDDRLDDPAIDLARRDFRGTRASALPDRPEGTFQFVHLSDVQIRDRAVTILADWLADQEFQSACHNFYQDHADAFYFGHILTAIRKGVEQGKFDAVVHTGDAVDLGIASEFWTYNYLVDKLLTGRRQSWLRAPFKKGKDSPLFLDLIGNHDCLFMGNFKYRTEQLKVRYQSDAIAKLNGTLGALNRLVTHRDPAWHGSYGLPDGLALNPRNAQPKPDMHLDLQANRGGYYCVDRPWRIGPTENGLVRLIVLNTYEVAVRDPTLERGALYPSISGAQKAWLRDCLNETESDRRIRAVLVFGHCQLAEITVLPSHDEASLRRKVGDVGKIRKQRNDTFLDVAILLSQYKKVVAYFCGHLHSGSPRITWSPDDDIVSGMIDNMNTERGKTQWWEGIRPEPLRPAQKPRIRYPFYEFIVPSIQAYPKCFSVVALTYADGKVRINVTYYNLQDLHAIKDPLCETAVTDVKSKHARKTLSEWRDALPKACRPRERAKRTRLLAEYAYLGARANLRGDSGDITGNFNPDLKEDLLKIYGRAKVFLESMVKTVKKSPKSGTPWKQIRKELEQPRPGRIPVAP